MALIIDTVKNYLPSKRKLTPSGWISFNAVCCHNNGTGKDTRQRGGIVFHDQSVSYHCFNCQFKSSWQPGRTVSIKFRNLLRWLNVPDDLITKCILEALRLKETGKSTVSKKYIPEFLNKLLPYGAHLVTEIIDQVPEDVLNYIKSRNLTIQDYPWYWTGKEGFENRLIIPFYYQSTIVGYTARKITNGKPKYISEQQPGYVFNIDQQYNDRKYCFVCEGPFDAISLQATAVLGNEISSQQRSIIESLGKEIVVIPDRDQAGYKLVNQAIEYKWAVAFPDWEDCKDISESVVKYGKLGTMYMIISSIETNELKIKLKSKSWFKGTYNE